MALYFHAATGRYIQDGIPFTLNDIQYPANWLHLATAEDLAGVGLQLVTATNTPADTRFYDVSERLVNATLTYVNTPKDLAELKTTWDANTKGAAYALLQPTDYIDLRNLRDPSYKVEWMTWREQVRQKSEEVCAAIIASATVPELEAAATNIDWPAKPDQV